MPLPPGQRNRYGASASGLILLGLVLQVLLSLLLFAVLGEVAARAGGPVAFAAAFLLIGVGLFFLFAGFVWSYAPTARGEYAAARTWTLVLGIVGIPLGVVIVGIPYLVAYLRLGQALREAQPEPADLAGLAPGASWNFSPRASVDGARALQPPRLAPTPALAPAPRLVAPPPGAIPPVCSQCYASGTWIPEYRRWYCYTCARYL